MRRHREVEGKEEENTTDAVDGEQGDLEDDDVVVNNAESNYIANRSIAPKDNDLEHVTNIYNDVMGKDITNNIEDHIHNGDINGTIDNTVHWQ